jgi:type III secretion protein T
VSVELFEAMQGFAFCTVRPSVALAMVPVASSGPSAVALRVPFVFAMALLPGLASAPEPLWSALLAEALMGLVLGLLLAVPFMVAQGAGAILDQQSGYTVASVFDPTTSREAAPLEILFGQLAVLALFTLPGSLLVVGCIAESWELWPPGSSGDIAGWMRRYAEHGFAAHFASALALAAPLLGLLLLAETALGLQSRYARQISPFTTALPIKIALLMFALAISLQHNFAYLSNVARATLSNLRMP